jgi:hypothetical protein
MIKQVIKSVSDIWWCSKELNEEQRWKAAYVFVVCCVIYFPLVFVRLLKLVFQIQIIERSLLCILWKILFGYKKLPMEINIGWNIVRTSAKIRVPIELIRAGTETKDGIKSLRLEETPHYKSIKPLIENNHIPSDDLEYENYMRAYQNGRNTGDKMIMMKKKVRDFAMLFKSGSHNSFVITYLPEISLRHGIKVELYDGVHRAVTAKVCGVKVIDCMLLLK